MLTLTEWGDQPLRPVSSRPHAFQSRSQGIGRHFLSLAEIGKRPFFIIIMINGIPKRYIISGYTVQEAITNKIIFNQPKKNLINPFKKSFLLRQTEAK